MAPRDTDLLQGTLMMMILKTLSWGPLHGYGITRWLHTVTADVLRVEEGSLYPALRRLEERGWLESEWGLSDNNRKARLYRLTPAGRAQLRSQVSEWNRLSDAVRKVVSATQASPEVAP
jgi:transcriptional regulator